MLDQSFTVCPDFFGLVLSLLFPVPILPDFPWCRFLETLLVATACSCHFLCQAWQNWACFLASKFCVAFTLSCRCLQMELWAAAAVTVVGILSQPALLMWKCVSAVWLPVLSPRASVAILHSRHHADYILPILVKKMAFGVIPATAVPKHLLGFHRICLSLK